MREIDEERIGVGGSLHRRILDLCRSVGLVLVDARHLGHLSKVTLIFRNEGCLTEVTIEDREIGVARG